MGRAVPSLSVPMRRLPPSSRACDQSLAALSYSGKPQYRRNVARPNYPEPNSRPAHAELVEARRRTAGPRHRGFSLQNPVNFVNFARNGCIFLNETAFALAPRTAMGKCPAHD